MYTTFCSGRLAKARRTASSEHTVLPLPVGAPSSTLLSVW